MRQTWSVPQLVVQRSYMEPDEVIQSRKLGNMLFLSASDLIVKCLRVKNYDTEQCS